MRVTSLKIAAIAAIAVASIGTNLSAQLREAPMTAARSRDIQNILASVESNKGAAVDQLLSDWQANVNSEVYDLSSEFRDIAMKAPAWQLYGAALTGDFKRFSRILRGYEGAGAYVNALIAPQPKVAAGFDRGGPYAIGAVASSLVYTPITPCRTVDTRGSGARTGLLLNGQARTFDMTTAGLAEGQGGAATCAGLPSYSHPAWAVNITVTNAYVAAGGLKAWGFNATEPNASVINFTTASSGGIANGLTLTGCDGCGDDITIRAFGDNTHIIIDVVGYYEEAVAAVSTVSRVAGTPVAITAGSANFGNGGACPAGTRLIGGENDFSGTRVFIGESRQLNATQWTMWMINDDGATRNPTVYSRCLDTPVQALP